MVNSSISYSCHEISKLFIEKIKKDSLMQSINPSYQYVFRTINERNGRINQKDICDKTHYKASSISILLKQMENEGLIERKKNNKDNREVIISMTKKGKDLDDKIKSIFEKYENKLQGCLDEKEKEFLHLVIDKLIMSLKEE